MLLLSFVSVVSMTSLFGANYCDVLVDSLVVSLHFPVLLFLCVLFESDVSDLISKRSSVIVLVLSLNFCVAIVTAYTSSSLSSSFRKVISSAESSSPVFVFLMQLSKKAFLKSNFIDTVVVSDEGEVIVTAVTVFDKLISVLCDGGISVFLNFTNLIICSIHTFLFYLPSYHHHHHYLSIVVAGHVGIIIIINC